MEEGYIVQHIMLEQLNTVGKNSNPNLKLTFCTKINSKFWIIGLYVKHEMVMLKEITGENLHDLNV